MADDPFDISAWLSASQPPMLQAPATMGLSPSDFDTLVRTVYGEANGQPVEGQQAVAHVILNRAAQSGMSPTDVMLAPNQFEPWGRRRQELLNLSPDSTVYQRIAANLQPVVNGEAPDPTGGATHFYAPRAQAALGRPPPAWDNGRGFDIGDHRFFNLGYSGSGQHGTGNRQMGVLDEMFAAPQGGPQGGAPRRGQLPSGELTNPMEPTTSDVQMRGVDQSPQAPQGGGGSWSEYLSNPDTRSFLISTGLQLMTGGWGNGLQQLGVAMGKGFEAQNANQIARSEDEQKAAERQNRSEIAAAGNTSREQVAAARNDATILRASIAAGAKTPAEQSMFQRDVNTFLQRLQSDVTNVGKPVEELMPRAVEMARQQMELRRVLGGEYGGGSGPQGQNGVSSSGVLPRVSPVVASVPPTQTPTGGQTPPSTSALPSWLRNMFLYAAPAAPGLAVGEAVRRLRGGGQQ